MSVETLEMLFWLCMMVLIMPILQAIFNEENLHDDGGLALLFIIGVIFWPLLGVFLMGVWLVRKVQSTRGGFR